MRTTGSGELGCRSRSCEARPESVATLGNAAGPDAQHSAVVTSGSCEKLAPPAQGDEVPGWPQQSADVANEHASAGKATPSRLIQITTTAVSRRSIRNNSRFPAILTVQGQLSSAMFQCKSSTLGVPCRGSRPNYHVDSIGGKGGTRTLDPGIMRFNNLPRGARCNLAPRSTTEHY
jgi:hypothetical protein